MKSFITLRYIFKTLVTQESELYRRKQIRHLEKLKNALGNSVISRSTSLPIFDDSLCKDSMKTSSECGLPANAFTQLNSLWVRKGTSEEFLDWF